jgi:hypothetical protein
VAYFFQAEIGVCFCGGPIEGENAEEVVLALHENKDNIIYNYFNFLAQVY